MNNDGDGRRGVPFGVKPEARPRVRVGPGVRLGPFLPRPAHRFSLLKCFHRRIETTCPTVRGLKPRETSDPLSALWMTTIRI